MKTQLKTLLCLVASAWTMTLVGGAQAQSYPSQPIKLIVPFAPGGAVDQVARIIGPVLSKRLGQAIVVENRPGAAGSVGAGELARAKPDGYQFPI